MPVGTPTRAISPELLEAILAEAGTLAACILITPETGDPVGFTTHDEEIEFEGETYYPDPGVTATELAAVITYAVDNLEIFGAFEDGLVEKSDVRGGHFDDADYTLFVVDYENPEYGDMIVQRGTLGNADVAGEKFTFELRSLSQKLQQTCGELTAPLCRARIFDERCKLDPAASHPTLAIPYRYTAVAVTEVLSRFQFKVSIPAVTIPAGYFEAGLLVWVAGANAGQRSEIKSHTVAGSVHTITLQESARSAFTVGDTLTVRKGCKGTLDACFDVGNVKNKRSEDYLPGLIETMRRS